MKTYIVLDGNMIRAAILASYNAAFDEMPSNVRLVRYKDTPGGYVKVYPGRKGLKYLRVETARYDEPATQGYDGYVADKKLIRMLSGMELMLPVQQNEVRIYWRQDALVRGRKESFLEMMIDHHIE